MAHSSNFHELANVIRQHDRIVLRGRSLLTLALLLVRRWWLRLKLIKSEDDDWARRADDGSWLDSDMGRVVLIAILWIESAGTNTTALTFEDCLTSCFGPSIKNDLNF